jgi:hypothetical protein
VTPPNDHYHEHEELSIIARHNRGEITRAQMNKELRELRDDERVAYEEDRERAIRNVNDQWGFG